METDNLFDSEEEIDFAKKENLPVSLFEELQV